MEDAPSWFAANYQYLLGSVPVAAGALLLASACIAILRNQATLTLVAIVAFGTALCGSAVFASISWKASEGKIETLAGALSGAVGTAERNNQSIENIRSALVALKQQVDQIVPAPAKVDPNGNPTLESKDSLICITNPALCSGKPGDTKPFDWNSILSNSAAFDAQIDTIGKSVAKNADDLTTIQKDLSTLQHG